MVYRAFELTRRAIAFIEQKHDGPFFIYLAYNATHAPMQAPDEVIKRHLKPGVDPGESVRCTMI